MQLKGLTSHRCVFNTNSEKPTSMSETNFFCQEVLDSRDSAIVRTLTAKHFFLLLPFVLSIRRNARYKSLADTRGALRTGKAHPSLEETLHGHRSEPIGDRFESAREKWTRVEEITSCSRSRSGRRGNASSRSGVQWNASVRASI